MARRAGWFDLNTLCWNELQLLSGTKTAATVDTRTSLLWTTATDYRLAAASAREDIIHAYHGVLVQLLNSQLLSPADAAAAGLRLQATVEDHRLAHLVPLPDVPGISAPIPITTPAPPAPSAHRLPLD